LEYKPLTRAKWVKYKPKAELLALDKVFHHEHYIPEFFMGKNVVHFPTVKCVHPDTEIFLSDGSLVKIEEYVNEIQDKKGIRKDKDGDYYTNSIKTLPSLEKGKIVNKKTKKVWKTKSPQKIYQIKTKTGKVVKVSKNHPFLTSEGWKKAKEIKKKERIAILRKINVKGKSQILPKIKELNHDKIDINKINFKKGKKHSIILQKKIIKEYIEGKTATQIAKEKNLHWETVRSIIKRYNVDIRWARNWVKVPNKTSKQFWKWMGYFWAEGYAKDCKGSMRFWWNNGNPEIVKEFRELTKKLFDINLKIKKVKNKLDVYYFDSNNIKPFFEELNLSFPMVAGNKIIPKILFKCPKVEIISFLEGYLDGDGTVGKDGLHAVSKSKRMIEQIQLLLLRLEVVGFVNLTKSIATNGKMRKKETYWQISVYGDELVKLSRNIKLKSENKQKNMKQLVKNRLNGRKPTNWDTIPVDRILFRKVREGLNFTQHSTGKPSVVNTIENGYGLPTKHSLNYFIKLFEKKDKNNKFKKEIEYIKFLTSDDIAWDHIEEIKQVKSDTEWLYDLTVPGTENFVGNGIILHNTHGHTQMTGAMKNAFGGLITQKRHHCHRYIHDVLVDLLQIQKEIHKGIFAVMDGTVCGDGAGPRTMEPRIKDYILASNDQVAIDAVSAKMMGFDPMKIRFIRKAHDLGLGCGDVEQLDIEGEDISRVNFKFKSKKSAVIMGDQLMRNKVDFIQKILFHTPLFKMCVFGSEFYHDRLWYPTIGRMKINKFNKTKWGKLWRKYEA
ncbi:DUF362 domain-containing protein, partial [archaeon]|nr:DUF362 domain-containing protein [archaeon]